MIMPFVKRLKRWLAEQNPKDHPMRLSSSGGPGCDAHSSTKSHSKFYNENVPNRRERLKSTGDLDDSRKYTGNASQSPHYIRKKDKQTPDNKSQYFLSKNDPFAGKDRDFVQSSSTKRKAEPKSNVQSIGHPISTTATNSKATDKITIKNLVDLIQNDKNIKKWGNFTFSIDNIVNVFAR